MNIFVIFMVIIGLNGDESINTVTGEAWKSSEDCQAELSNYKHIQSESVSLFCADPILYTRGK